MEVKHKGWNWNEVNSSSWNQISEEFFPIAYNWKNKFQSILDIGAGKGRHAFFFAENGFEVGAIDLSESGIEYIKNVANEKKLNVNAVVADMTNLPFEDNRFDCVICFHTIYHTDYNGVKKALQEIRRILKNGGEAFISFNSKENPNYVESESPDGFTIIKDEGGEKGIPHCYLNEYDLFDILSDFKIISMNKIQNYVRKGRDARGIHFYVHISAEK